MNKEKSSKFKYVMGIIMIFVITLGAKINFGTDWFISFIIGSIGGIIIFLLIHFNILKEVNKEDKEAKKKQFESYSTEQLRVMIKERKELDEYLIKEFNKRKDKTTNERLGDLFIDLIGSGMIILIVGLFYIGAIAPYFNVNDEFINPSKSNSTIVGFENAFDNLQNITTNKIFIQFHDIGARSPTLWFWSWWFVVFMFMILPVIKFIYYLIKQKLGGKNGK